MGDEMKEYTRILYLRCGTISWKNEGTNAIATDDYMVLFSRFVIVYDNFNGNIMKYFFTIPLLIL